MWLNWLMHQTQGLIFVVELYSFFTACMHGEIENTEAFASQNSFCMSHLKILLNYGTEFLKLALLMESIERNHLVAWERDSLRVSTRLPWQCIFRHHHECGGPWSDSPLIVLLGTETISFSSISQNLRKRSSPSDQRSGEWPHDHEQSGCRSQHFQQAPNSNAIREPRSPIRQPCSNTSTNTSTLSRISILPGRPKSGSTIVEDQISASISGQMERSGKSHITWAVHTKLPICWSRRGYIEMSNRRLVRKTSDTTFWLVTILECWCFEDHAHIDDPRTILARL